MMAETYGRATGYCKGKSGHLHISVAELGVILTSTIVGGELSLATGVGLSLSMQKTDAIVACIFGDGAACEGVFHESLNLAAVWSLPVLYVCENNQWQAFVARRETMLAPRIASRAAAYGVESKTVDGNDVEEVAAAAREAASLRARDEEAVPSGDLHLPDARALRAGRPGLRGPRGDRPVADKGPIETAKTRLLERSEIAPAEFEAMELHAREIVDRAAKFAAESPFPRLRRAAHRRVRVEDVMATISTVRRNRAGPRRGDAARRDGRDVRRRRRDEAKGPREGVRRQARAQHAARRGNHRRHGGGRRGDGPATRHRHAVRALPLLRDRGDRQQRGQAPLHLGRAVRVPHGRDLDYGLRLDDWRHTTTTSSRGSPTLRA